MSEQNHPLVRLQRLVGNAALTRALQAPSMAVQRSVDDLYTLINTFQGRLGSGPGVNGAALAIATELADFADRGNDDATRAEIRRRAPMVLADLRAAGINSATSTQVQNLLRPLELTGGRPEAVSILAATRAVDVLKALQAGTATITGLRTKWYVSGPDRGTSRDSKGNRVDGYSTAYNVGIRSAWEIHVHRRANGSAYSCTVQSAAAVGNTNVTRAMPLDPEKLVAVGVPAKHDPRKTAGYNRWGPL